MPAAKEGATSVRISRAASALLDALSRGTGKSKVELLDDALKKLDSDLFWKTFNEGYSQHGADVRQDLAGTEGSLLDGLEAERT